MLPKKFPSPPNHPPPRQRTDSSTDHDPHPLGIGPEARVEKVVRNLHVGDVRLVQFEAEPARGEDGGEGEVELAVREAGTETHLVSESHFIDA